MKYYIYKLECQGHTNHVIADENGPDYRCKSTRGEEIYMDKNHDNELALLELSGIEWDRFLFQGRIYKQLHLLAQAMKMTVDELRFRLIRYRLWLEPWPKDLVEFVNGEPVPHLRFIRKTHSDNTQVLDTHETYRFDKKTFRDLVKNGPHFGI